MNKYLLLFILTTALSLSVAAQSNKVQSAWNALKFKELDKAKAAIDLAAEHPDTKNDVKMWYYRGKVYLAINDDKDKFKNLDPEAGEKALVSFLNCMKEDNKKAYGEEVSKLILESGVKIYNKGLNAFANKNYDMAIRYMGFIPEIFPYDKENFLARNNITPDILTYNFYIINRSAGNMAKAKEYAQKLIDISYKDPEVYLDMGRMWLADKDTAKALAYIEKGRYLFEDNLKLINAEVGIYAAQKKMDVLLEKTSKSIEAAPDNEMLYCLQGTILEQKGDMDRAETAYKKAIELKPDYADANSNLGSFYFNKGVDYNKKANDLPLDQAKKVKEYDDKATESFKNAIPYLEKAHELSPADKAVTQTLLKLYQRTGDTEKYNQLKETLNKK